MNSEVFHSHEPNQTEAHAAARLVRVAQAAGVRTIFCVDETVATCLRVRQLGAGLRLLAASPSREVCRALAALQVDVMFLPVRFLNRYKQAQNAIGGGLQHGKLAAQERLLCSVGSSQPDAGEFLLVLEAGARTPALSLQELTRNAEGVRAAVIEAAITAACGVARAARRGKRLGAIFVLGDSENVLRQSRQLVPNPFENVVTDKRSLLNPNLHETLVELAKLDGAYVARGDGLIRTAGAFLGADPKQVRLPQGLGARHLAAASITARTSATAIVVSATDGQVRVFSSGELVLQLDPDSL